MKIRTYQTKKDLLHLNSHFSRNVLYLWICILGQLHTHSLFPYILRTYTFRILLCSICFLHCLFCNGCSVRNTIKESRLQTRNHVWLYVNRIRSLHICSSRFSTTIRNFPDRFVLHRNRSGNPANGS